MRLLRRRTRKERASDAAKAVGEGLHEQFDALVRREWDRLAKPGTWWTGEERVAIAREARAAFAGADAPGELDEPSAAAARRVAAQPASIRRSDIQDWSGAGLQPFAYVELVGVVSRLAAIDVATFGLDRPAAALPEPEPGEPSRERPDGAEVTTGWVPTIGPASAPSSLSAVPAEHDAMFEVHGVLYASMQQMFDLELERNGLRRPQIELVAARTSRLNDCVY